MHSKSCHTFTYRDVIPTSVKMIVIHANQFFHPRLGCGWAEINVMKQKISFRVWTLWREARRGDASGDGRPVPCGPLPLGQRAVRSLRRNHFYGQSTDYREARCIEPSPRLLPTWELIWNRLRMCLFSWVKVKKSASLVICAAVLWFRLCSRRGVSPYLRVYACVCVCMP